MSCRGFLLMEMLVVMTIWSVMLGIGVGMLHVLLRAERTGRDRVHRATVSSRLAEQFRSDVEAAVRPIPAQANQPAQWQFAMAGDRTITYRALPGEVQRDERAAGKLVRQESYALPDGRSAAITVESKAKPALASLVILGDSTCPVVGRELRVTALLGKDHRFTKPVVGGQ